MKTLDIATAFKYPFNRATGMWNILWVLLPIIGWFALGGYTIRIIKEFSEGKFKELPTFKFSSDLKLGFYMFLKAIPFIIACSVITTVFFEISELAGGIAEFVLGLFIFPILTINFFNKQTVGSYFELKILKSVFNNFGDYIVVLLKSILLGIVFAIMIIVLVGLPAGSFTKNIFLADFYRRRV